ncbi:hypothetical protein Tco_0268145 [Tanacetum coccineum]
MTSMNTRLNIEKLDENIVQKHGGSKQVGLKQLGSKQVGFKQLGQKQVGFKQLGPGVETGFHESNKRNIKLPTKFNDHVMSSKQKSTNIEASSNIEEIRANNKGIHQNNEDLGEDKLRDEVNSNMNDRFDEIGEDELGIKSVENTDCDNSVKECLDDGVEVNKQDEISSKGIDKLVMDEMDKNKVDEVEIQNGPKKPMLM